MTVRHPFGVAVLADDHDAAMATLADDVVFSSPAVYKPYEGKETVEQILRLVATVFENFRYTNEWRDGRTTCSSSRRTSATETSRGSTSSRRTRTA